MRASSRLWVVAVALCATGVAACTPAEGDGPDEASAASAQSEPGGPSAPFNLRVERIRVAGMDNAEILGTAAIPVRDEAASAAVRGAREVLATFLNAQFVDEGTRFSAGPIDALLTNRAKAILTEEDRAGLGHLNLAVEKTKRGPASATATVLVHGDAPHAVTLAYTALLTIVADDGERPVKQHGTVTFVPTDTGWLAEAVDVSLEVS